MPTYEYRCHKCKQDFEVEQSIRDCPLDKCVLCKSKKIERLISSPYLIIHNENTVYSLAKKNEKELGKEQIAIKAEQRKQDKKNKKDNLSKILKEVAPQAEIKTNAKLPWYNKDGTDLKKKFEGKSKRQIQKFINEGNL